LWVPSRLVFDKLDFHGYLSPPLVAFASASISVVMHLRSGEAICDILKQFQAYLVSTMLEQVASGIHDGDGVPGQFFRIARRTTVVAPSRAPDESAAPHEVAMDQGLDIHHT
jgi:hypothetical protein